MSKIHLGIPSFNSVQLTRDEISSFPYNRRFLLLRTKIWYYASANPWLIFLRNKGGGDFARTFQMDRLQTCQSCQESRSYKVFTRIVIVWLIVQRVSKSKTSTKYCSWIRFRLDRRTCPYKLDKSDAFVSRMEKIWF